MTKQEIDDCFFHSSSVREYTQDFIHGDMTGRGWVKKLWPKKSKDEAQRLLKVYGVYTTRKKLKRYGSYD